jgi:hypothetical protein
LKVAAALMALEGRRQAITQNDWERAGIVMAVSDATRKAVLEKLSSQRVKDNANRGRLEGVRADIAEQTKADRAVKRVANNIVRKLVAAGGEMARSDMRDKKIAYRDRESYFDDAEMLLIEANRIEKVSSENDGPDGFVLRLPGEASK